MRFCESFVSRSKESALTSEQISGLSKLGYSATSVERLSRLRPDLVIKILANPEQSKPLKVFRGLTVAREEYDPKFLKQRSRLLSYRGFGNANSAWVARKMQAVLDFTSTNGALNGIILVYEIPAFMLLDDSRPPKVLAASEMIGQLSREAVGGDESPFIYEIIEMNGKKISVMESMAWAKAQGLPFDDGYKYYIKKVVPAAEALPLPKP
jgi:hypothetical protein